MADASRISTELPHAWQAPDVPGLELLGGALGHHEFPRHSHDGLMLAVIHGGAQRLRYRGSSYVASARQVVAMPPREVHAAAAAAAEGWRYRVLTVPERLWSRFLGDDGARGFASPVVLDDPELAVRLSRTYAAFADRHTTLEREQRLLDALALYFTRHARPAPVLCEPGLETHAVHRAMDYLVAHRHRSVALSELSAACGLDGYRLTRAFTRSVGMPPYAYHLQARLRAAQAALARGVSVTEVAHQVGFADQAHFTRHFKRLTGVTPGRYRAAHGHPRFRR